MTRSVGSRALETYIRDRARDGKQPMYIIGLANVWWMDAARLDQIRRGDQKIYEGR